MDNRHHRWFFIILFAILASTPYSTSQLQSSQFWSLLRLQRLLNYPPALSSWNNHTDVCHSDPSPSLTVVCYEDSISQLHIIGESGSPPLPADFSIDSFFKTLTRLPDLKVLTLSSLGLWGPLPAKIWRLTKLEILNVSSNRLSGSIPYELGYLNSLQTLILDHNLFSGSAPDWLSAVPLLAVLSLKNNSLNGTMPESISSSKNLRVLSLSANCMSGQLPDLRSLSNLQVLDLEDNSFGPQFPALQRKIATIKLRNNKFTGALPREVGSYYLLHHLDVSSNRFVGPLPSELLNLPSIRYLNISGNRFTGMLFQNMSCNDDLQCVDLSSNLLTGSLPTCLDSPNSASRNVAYAMNCLDTKDKRQHLFPFCQTEALAVGVLPRSLNKTRTSKGVIVTSVVGGLMGGAVLLGLVIFFGAKKMKMRKTMKSSPQRLIEHASYANPSKLLSDARYISQTMKLGALGIPAYRSFSLEELEAATNNFESSALMCEGSHSQMYRGKLKDDSHVAMRCLKLKRNYSSHNLSRHIELIAKLRHRHLVSALGHCLEYCLEDSTVSRLFLIFEYVPNGSLRSHISGVAGQKITWTERISAAIGVAKGIEFLHSGIVPGFFSNNLKTTNILLDQNFVAKISSYNLPLLSEIMKTEVNGKALSRREKNEDKIDIYDFGVILLEIITGKPFDSQNEVELAADQLRASIAADGAARKRGMVDPTVVRACSNESLRTVIAIGIRCVTNERTMRPSIEDVLWNLQFAAQVQDAWRGDSQSSDGSFSPSHLPQSLVNVENGSIDQTRN